MKNLDWRLWLGRLLIAAVIAWNLQAAISLLAFPGQAVAAFELSGEPGIAALRGVAVLFIMWNVPYALACWQPRLHRRSLWEALVMQCIGLVGETWILFTVPAGHALLANSLLRFVAFDAAGLIFLAAALRITRSPRI